MNLPLMLNIKDKKVVIIGGGPVGLKKAQKIHAYGGALTVIGLSLMAEFNQLQGVKPIQATYEKRQISGAWLVIAATENSALNLQIYEDCKREQILCNIVDNPSLSDVIFPASLQKGELTISVSTGGNSPLLAKEILSTVESLCDAQFDRRLLLLGEVRKHIIETEKDKDRKQLRLESILHDTVATLEAYLEEIRKGDIK